MTNSKVEIIVLNYKKFTETIRCLHSLQEINYPHYEITVVDNHSENESVEKIKREFPEIKILETEKNLGYAGGNNFALKNLMNKDSSLFLILNPDTVITPNFLDLLVKNIQSEENIGITGPKIYQWQNGPTEIISDTGSNINWKTGDIPPIGRGEKDEGQYSQIESRDKLTGACLLIKREVLEKTGLMPEEYFLYFEETDFCVQATKEGFKILYTPESIIYHQGQGSVGKNSPIRNYYYYRNWLYFMKKFRKEKHQDSEFIFHFTRVMGFQVFCNLKKFEFKNILSLFLGILHFFLNKKGQGPEWLEKTTVTA